MVSYSGLWNGVIAARVPGMTAHQTPDTKPCSFYCAVPVDCFAGILRAAWSKTTRGRFKRANQILVTTYRLDQDSAHCVFNRLNRFASPSRWVHPFTWIARRTITTKSIGLSLISCKRKVSLTTRLVRLRSTARGRFFLLAITPSLARTSCLRTKKTLKF